MEELTTIGRPTRRVDAREMVLGTARFTDDLHVPGMLVAKVLRSSVPYAEIVAIDVTAALLVPGVKAAITSVRRGHWSAFARAASSPPWAAARADVALRSFSQSDRSRSALSEAG